MIQNIKPGITITKPVEKGHPSFKSRCLLSTKASYYASVRSTHQHLLVEALLCLRHRSTARKRLPRKIFKESKKPWSTGQSLSSHLWLAWQFPEEEFSSTPISSYLFICLVNGDLIGILRGKTQVAIHISRVFIIDPLLQTMVPTALDRPRPLGIKVDYDYHPIHPFCDLDLFFLHQLSSCGLVKSNWIKWALILCSFSFEGFDLFRNRNLYEENKNPHT